MNKICLNLPTSSANTGLVPLPGGSLNVGGLLGASSTRQVKVTGHDPRATLCHIMVTVYGTLVGFEAGPLFMMI